MSKFEVYHRAINFCYRIFYRLQEGNAPIRREIDIPLHDIEMELNRFIEFQICYDLEKEDV